MKGTDFLKKGKLTTIRRENNALFARNGIYIAEPVHRRTTIDCVLYNPILEENIIVTSTLYLTACYTDCI